MKAFKVDINLTVLNGFDEKELQDTIKKNLGEVFLKLLQFSYIEGNCTCIVEFKELSIGIPYHQYTLGCFTSLPTEYPYIRIDNIVPSFIDIN